MNRLQPHGVKGLLNIYRLDKEDVVTGHGVHERVVGFEPNYDSRFGCIVRYCRIDLRYNLPVPTESQVKKVLKSWPIEAKGRLFEICREHWEDGRTIDVYLKCG